MEARPTGSTKRIIKGWTSRWLASSRAGDILGAVNIPVRRLRPLRALLILFPLTGDAFRATAEVVVNPPQAITHRIEIQPIRTRKAAGATATIFGLSVEETYIKAQVDRVWAQAGVRIDWLPAVDYTNDFAYDGSPDDYSSTPRPDGHLDMIVNSAGSPPKSANPVVLDMFFVEIVPGFEQLPANAANGDAFSDRNGAAIHVGDDLPGFEGGRDVVAKIAASLIGLNLGLGETAGDNLMNSGGTSGRLTPAQKPIIFTNNTGVDGFDLLQPLPSSEYSQWAASNAVTGGPAADDEGDGIPNVIEFMFNLNPKAFSLLPQPVASAAGLTWTLPKRQEALDDGLVYQVETSVNFQSWAAAGSAGSGSTIPQNDASTLVVHLDPGAIARFMRLNISIPPDLAGG